MKPIAYCLFETPLGSCGIAWSESADVGGPPTVTHFQLPEGAVGQTELRIAQRSGARPGPAPPQIAELIDRVRQHLQGDVQDFRDVVVDLNGVGSFARKVYEAARAIPIGETVTYGELAKTLKCPNAARAVGQALGRNPVALLIPCHRILAAGGKPGGFSAHGGQATKARLLEVEGVPLEVSSRNRQ